MIFTSGTALSALRPGVHEWYGLGYNRYPEQFSQIFEMLKSEMNYERDVNMYGLGVARVRPEATQTEYDFMGEGFRFDYIPVDYSNGIKISHQAIRDNLYMKLGEEFTKELGNSFRECKEIVAARLFNSAFSSSITYADGLQLCSSAHLLSGGGTFANTPSVDCDLSELAIENAVQQIQAYTDDRGKLRRVVPQMLIVPRGEQFNANRILMSNLRSGTAENDINVLNAQKVFSKGIMVYQYLTDADAWFIQTDAAKGMRYFQREPLQIQSDVEFDTDAIKIKGYEAYSVGCTDLMGIWGTAGA